MDAIFFNEHGSIENLQFGNIKNPIPKSNEVLLKVTSVALNHLDLWVLKGWKGLDLKMPHIGGSDIVGEIIEVKQNSKFKVSDKVAVFPGYSSSENDNYFDDNFSVSPNFKVIGEHCQGGLAEFICVPEKNLYLLENNHNSNQTSASILTGLTSWRMLFKKTNLKNAKTILIVGSGGGVNITSLLIVKTLGITTIILAGGKEKLIQAKELGADFVIDYKENIDWHKEVIKITKGSGVDIVIDNVGEKTFLKSLKSLSFGGSLLTVGNTSGFNISFDNRLIFAKQINILGSTMGSFNDFLDSQKFFKDNNIKIPIDSIYSLKDGIKAFERLESGNQFGKIIINPCT